MGIEELDAIEYKYILRDSLIEYRYSIDGYDRYDEGKYSKFTLFIISKYRDSKRRAIINFNKQIKRL
jgi:hypothetical protein